MGDSNAAEAARCLLMRECTLTTESRTGKWGILAQVVKCAPRVCGDDPASSATFLSCSSSAPRVCGDDPYDLQIELNGDVVLPAYAGMILAEKNAYEKNN